MIDIRAVSKVFLDFVYEQEMLPIDIIKIIDENDSKNDPEYSVKWDIRAILDLLKYKEKYKPGNTKQKTYQIKKEISEMCYLLSDRECDSLLREWLVGNKRQIGDAVDFCNDFFHNVKTDSGIKTFCTNLKELIENSKIKQASDYTKKIDDIIQKTNGNNANTPDSYEKDKDNSALEKVEKQSNNIFDDHPEKPRTTIKNNKNDYRALRRIPRWAIHPEQINSKIVWSYFKAEAEFGRATKSLMRKLCEQKGMSEKYFDSNYAAMKSDAGKCHGKTFEDDGENVWIWDEVKSELLKYKNMFLNRDK